MKKSTKIVILVVAIYTLVLAVGISVFLLLRKSGEDELSPKETVQAFVDAYNAENVSKMLNYVDPELAESTQDLIDYADEKTSGKVSKAILALPIVSYFKGDEGMLPDIEVEIKDSSQDGDTAKVYINGRQKNGKLSLDLTANLKKIDGKWYLTGADLTDE